MVLIIFKLTEQQAENSLAIVDSDEKAVAKALIDILENTAYFSETQEQLTANLTLLRNTAIRSGVKSLFDRCLNAAKGNIDPKDMNGCEWRFCYNSDDFGNSEEPYREVFFQPTAFLKQRALDRLTIEASKCGFRGFKATYKAFEQSMRQVNNSNANMLNPSDFPNQPIELECGEWRCDSTGVSKVMKDRVEYACLHPIMPVERFVNIDTGEHKLRVAFFKGRYWRDFTANKRDLFDSSKIIQFSGLGVSVTSKSAKLLSEYLCDIETLNPDIIPETESVGRLGYIGDGNQFSPYVDNIVFDGDANYHTIYNAISERGDYEKWLAEAIKCRSESLTARIMLAASFASVLVGKIGCLPFFVHLWGVESGTGKTVALMLAASVWGNPDIGQYIQTFNATQVGHEKTAAFLNNIPMCIDELQLSKDSHGHSKFDVYQLAQGVGRTRGNKGGGIDTTPTWSLCVLTTGESPLTSESSGAGALNRVIDIECKACDSVIKDGFRTSSCVKQNYGFAGRKFVEALKTQDMNRLTARYQELFKKLSEGATTEKQAMAAALIILADELADELIFKTKWRLTVSEMSLFLKTKASVSAGERGYAYMCDWVAMNMNRFKTSENNGECYGLIDGDWAYINNSVFRNAAKNAGFDDRALLSWLKSNSIIQTRGRNYTRGKRINGINTECVVLKLKQSNEILHEDSDDGLL